MTLRASSLALSVVLAFAFAGCGASEGFEEDEGGSSPRGAGTDETGAFGTTRDGGGAPSAANCKYQSADPNKDYDGDGFALKDDCNECDVSANRGAFDVPGNGVDEDCNGTPDDEKTNCDDGLKLAATDPFDGAKAIGLCKRATDAKMWGVVEAAWVKPDGTPQTEPLSQGILTKLGVNKPRAGKAMLAISSGSARNPTDSGYHAVSGWGKGSFGQGAACGTPAGYPKVSPSCKGAGEAGGFKSAYDGAALLVKVRVPTNAKSFKYQQNFFTYEFPDYICSSFNDFFITFMAPKLSNLPDGNIAFDQDGNPISVNNSFLQVCKPQSAGGKPFKCPLGDATLAGTGFEGHAASGWLTTTAPVDSVRGKEMTLRWAIWDQNDGNLDSTALIDDFAWSVDAASASTAPSSVK